MMSCIKTSVFLFVTAVVVPCVGQQNIVILDMGKVFSEHAGFKSAIETLQKEVDGFKLSIQQDRLKIQSQSEGLAGMERTSDEYKAKEASIAKSAADMQVNHNMKNRDFMEREAALYYQTYVDILNTVHSFSEQNNITLVIRYSNDKMDPTDRASVLKGVTNQVVFHRQRDITDSIIQLVNRNAGVANQNNNVNR